MVAQLEKRPGVPAGAPRGLMPAQVIWRKAAAPGAVTLALARPGTLQAPAPYLPGQFITLALPTPRGTITRSYSLCSEGRADRPWEITVKKAPGGVGSNYLHDTVREGTLLYASQPRGLFTLPARVDAAMQVIFVAVGSGITPIMGMLRALAQMPAAQRPQVQLHYASRQPNQTIFLNELEALDPQQTWLRRRYYFSSQGVRLSPQVALASAGGQPWRFHWYICGPETLKHDLLWTLTNARVPAEQLHSEVFTSPLSLARASGPILRRVDGAVTARVRVAETGAALSLRADETLLEGLERHGYQPDYSCRAGACGTCKLRVLAGQVSPTGNALTPAERRAGYVLSCVAHPLGDVTIASGGQPPAPGRAGLPAAGGRAHRQALVRRMRVLTAVGALGLMLGVWNLTTNQQSSAQTTAPSNSAASGSDDASSGSSRGNSSGDNASSGSSQSSSQNFPPPSTQSGSS
jgi:ferredoxin-NADP reductase